MRWLRRAAKSAWDKYCSLPGQSVVATLILTALLVLIVQGARNGRETTGALTEQAKLLQQVVVALTQDAPRREQGLETLLRELVQQRRMTAHASWAWERGTTTGVDAAPIEGESPDAFAARFGAAVDAMQRAFRPKEKAR